MMILKTERLILRELVEADAEFILELLNQPSFIKYIGDRNVRTVDESRSYVESRMVVSYEQFGYGMYLVKLKETRTPIGVCGFVKRDSLPFADIGFAFLQNFESKGYGFESAAAVLEFGKNILRLERILAIASQDNMSSHKLLKKLGFKYERLVKLPHDEEELKMFSVVL